MPLKKIFPNYPPHPPSPPHNQWRCILRLYPLLALTPLAAAASHDGRVFDRTLIHTTKAGVTCTSRYNFKSSLPLTIQRSYSSSKEGGKLPPDDTITLKRLYETNALELYDLTSGSKEYINKGDPHFVKSYGINLDAISKNIITAQKSGRYLTGIYYQENIMGMVGLNEMPDKEIMYYKGDPDLIGNGSKGAMVPAVSAFCDELFYSKKTNEVRAVMDLDNTSSEKLAKLVGLRKYYSDNTWKYYSITRQEWQAKPRDCKTNEDPLNKHQGLKLMGGLGLLFLLVWWRTRKSEKQEKKNPKPSQKYAQRIKKAKQGQAAAAQSAQRKP
jgi:RimJ/RimL family protein N-acetyltransferase